jgi:hypothetical protein
MAQNNMCLVWSPKTNNVLYGETTDILCALDTGVTVALGPDWSITGSDNLLEELKVAYEYSKEHLNGAITPRDLFKMVTSNAAIVAGVNDPIWYRLGKIEVGYQADLFLTPKLDSDPYKSLLKTYSKDIQLVIIDGDAVYGDPHLMSIFTDVAELDTIVVSYKNKMVDLIDPLIGPIGEQRYNEMIDLLELLYWDIAPLIEDEPGSRPGFPRNLF